MANDTGDQPPAFEDLALQDLGGNDRSSHEMAVVAIVYLKSLIYSPTLESLHLS
jgi:hypothetical protein